MNIKQLPKAELEKVVVLLLTSSDNFIRGRMKMSDFKSVVRQMIKAVAVKED